MSPRRTLGLMCVLSGLASGASAQDIDVSVIRAAGAICAAGFNLETQNRFDTRLTTAFTVLRGGRSSAVNPDQAGMVLETLTYDPADDAEESYMKCVSETIRSVLAVSDAAVAADSGREVIDSTLVADPLDVMQSGDRFQMGIGDSRAVGSQTLLFALHKVALFNGRNYVTITKSDVFEATSETVEVYQATTLKLNESCALNPYSIDLQAELASFLVICR
ncbi:hypothetical protein [Antarctobacter heliothermus]|uniref:Uncharacterized protein n=1 Tax=Antarctobacter heliothermus TaxID=74033 RepID=A0A239DN21_9RHOB|nr:hypothetical protein [Antarctobacter heliothermus]SNS34015.1 hypothetical protein SAMN04488078_101177 [Antarctobacter heliothermus]